MKKLIKCKVCGKEISKSAKSCPHCGELSASSKMMKTGLGLMGFGFAIIIIIPIALIVVGMIVAAMP